VTSLLYRTLLIAVCVGTICATFAITEAWACGTCNAAKAPGDWEGNCFYINNPGCTGGTECQGTTCITNPACENQQKHDVSLCTANEECLGGGDSRLPGLCTTYTRNCQGTGGGGDASQGGNGQ
jgi:hypothetical protein